MSEYLQDHRPTHSPQLADAQTPCEQGWTRGMVTTKKSISHRAMDFARDESGTTIVEFSITFLLLISIALSVFEFSYLKAREVVLDRATDNAFRELRLGLIPEPNHDKVKTAICEDELAAQVLWDCEDNLLLEVREVPKSNWNIAMDGPICLDTTPAEDYEPPIVFTPGAENQLMVARACLIQRPVFLSIEALFPFRRYDERGNFSLISKSAFVNEPS